MKDMLDALIRRSLRGPDPDDYWQDGLLMCGKCNTPRQKRLELNGAERVVGVLCQCRIEQQAKEEARRKAEENRLRIETMRANGFLDAECMRWTFDRAQMTSTLNKCQRYAEKFGVALEKNLGLLLWGPPGVGKSFAAACIVNALVDNGISAYMVSLPWVLGLNDRDQVLHRLTRTSLFVLDDFGAERLTDFGLEVTYTVVNERYKTGKPTIVTTNLPLQTLQNTTDIRYKRIYDRVLEMCVPIMVKGDSRRPRKAADKRDLLKEVLKDDFG